MKESAGILNYRKIKEKIEILLVHPGGPFWKNKDKNTWSIPKGEIKKNDNSFETAIREFEEETSLKLDQEDINKISYFTVIKNINKLVHVYLLEKDFGNLENFKPYMISIKIPFHNKKIIIPEVDKIGYFDLSLAKEKLVVYQKILVDKLLNYLNSQSK
jgi:predicted NUDIX family NTP pyrophosphohydrolase